MITPCPQPHIYNTLYVALSKTPFASIGNSDPWSSFTTFSNVILRVTGWHVFMDNSTGTALPYMHVHNNPLGLGEVCDDGEMFEDDLEGDPVGEVFEDDPECDPVGDSVIIDSLESISST